MITIEKLEGYPQSNNLGLKIAGVINPNLSDGIQSIFYIGLYGKKSIYHWLCKMDGPTTVVERMEKPLFFRGNLIMKTKGRRS
jgi:hypothetical protein